VSSRVDKSYKIKSNPQSHVCRIVENGQSCTNKVHDRGVCQRHRMALERRGLLENYAAKSQKITHSFSRKKNMQEGLCSVIEDGVDCVNVVDKRGLCAKHASRFYRDGNYEKFGSTSKQVYVEKSKYEINEKSGSRKCRIIENGVLCLDNIHSRGLCIRHRLVFDRHNMLDDYGTPSQLEPHKVKVKKNIEDGVCRINDNGEDCLRKVVNRGLCSMHRNRFYRHGTLSKYGLKSKR